MRVTLPFFRTALASLIVVAGIWTLAVFEVMEIRDQAFTQENQANKARAQAYEQNALRSIEVLDQALLVLRNEYTQSRSGARLDALVDLMQLSKSYVGLVLVIGPGGAVVSTGQWKNNNFSDRAYFQHHATHAEDKLLIGAPILGRLTNKWLIPFTRRLTLADGSFGGVVLMAIDPEQLAASPEILRLAGGRASMALIGLDGITRVRNNNGKVSYGDNASASQLFKEIPKAAIGQYEGVAASDGVRRTASYRVLKDHPLVVVAASSLDDIKQAVSAQQSLYLAFALVSSVFFLGFMVVVKAAVDRARQDLKKVRASEIKLRSILELSPVPTAIFDSGQKVLMLNRAFTETFGYTMDEVPDISAWWPLAYPDPAYRKVREDTWAGGDQGNNVPVEVVVRCKNGSSKTVVVAWSPPDPVLLGDRLVSLFDISEVRASQVALTTLVADKNALLREVHHRVKNNLQVITSLLRLEGGRNTNVQALPVLQAMQGRIRSMALLHETLYRSGTNAAVDLSAYLAKLAQEAMRATAPRGSRVHLALDLQETWADMDQANACGLLVNEWLSNALKHGFADGRDGTITLSLRRAPHDGQVVLEVSDDGAGLPADWQSRSEHSLGLQLAGDLAQQLNGTLDIGPAPLARFAVTFAVDSVSGFTPLTA